MTMVDKIKTASSCQCEAEPALFQKEVPSQSSDSHTYVKVVKNLFDMNEENSNIKGNIRKKLTEKGQILILDSKDCKNNDSDVLEMEEGDNMHYICVEAVPSEPTDPPKANYPQNYTILVILFGGLAGLFGVLFVKLINLTKEQKDFDDPQSFKNVHSPGALNSDVNNKLINILIKSQQRVISSEETRVLLDKECSFSETTINEILKNF